MAYLNEAGLSEEEINAALYGIDDSQGSEEWHRRKLGKVSASNVRKVVNRNRYGKPYAEYEKYMNELVAQRITGKAKRFTSGPIEWGKESEPLAVEAYVDLTDNYVYETSFVEDDEIDNAGASSDRLVNEDGNLEVKCPNTDTFVKYVLDNKVPDIYYDQCMWQMYVNKKEWTDFVAHDPDITDGTQVPGRGRPTSRAN